jgi:8-oxo-dGTP pyrophosphatase MutT (NUDIX family)
MRDDERGASLRRSVATSAHLDSLSANDRRTSSLLYRGKYFSFLRTADGWEYLENEKSRHVVAVAAVTPDGMLVLVEQDRPPVMATVLELPAGLAETVHLPAEACREFSEETGGQLLNPKELFKAPVLPGLTSSTLHVYTGDAHSIRRTNDAPLASEVTAVVLLPLTPLLRGDISSLSLHARIVDQTVYSALLHLRRRDAQA